MSSVEDRLRAATEEHRARRIAAAIAGYEGVLGMQPEHAEAHNNLGVALHDLGRREEAIARYERAIRARPECCAAIAR